MQAPFETRTVLHLTTTIDRGGAENYLVDVIRAQVRAGFVSIHCVFLKGRPYWQDELTQMGVKVTGLESRFYGDPRALWRLRRALKQLRPDFIHVHGAPAEAYLFAASRLARKPARWIVTRHEPRRRLFRYPGFKLLDGLISKEADRIIAVSQTVRVEDVGRWPELASKTSVIHHGIDARFAAGAQEAGRSVRKEFDIADDEVLIGTVARHTSEKSLDTLLHAFAEAGRTLAGCAKLRLMLIGRGPLTDELKALANELGIAERTIWLLFRDDMPAIMAAFDVFVLASREEGFGIVLIEAMACARPVVACGIDAIPEIVIDEETGLVIPPLDAGAMAAALARVAADAGFRARLGENGKRRVAEHFTTPTMQARTLQVYEDLIAELPRGRS